MDLCGDDEDERSIEGRWKWMVKSGIRRAYQSIPAREKRVKGKKRRVRNVVTRNSTSERREK